MDRKFVHISIIGTEILSKAKNTNNSRNRPPRLKVKMGMKRGEEELTRGPKNRIGGGRKPKYSNGLESVSPNGLKGINSHGPIIIAISSLNFFHT